MTYEAQLRKRQFQHESELPLFLAAIDLFDFKPFSYIEALDQAAFSIIPIITIVVSSRGRGHAIHLHQLSLEPGQRLTLIVQ